MAQEHVERRLAAILVADVVGYGRLMGEDEVGTLAALKTHRTEFIDPKIAEHHGRIFKLMGDGALVEFASVVDAVACAVDIQRGMAERNAEVSEDRRIEFRIGVNLGDVIVEGDDIYGDGVNVAARLQELAKPGGICIAGGVYDQVTNKLALGYEYLGKQKIKNIAEPRRAYWVLMEPEAAGQVIGEAKPATQPWKWAALAAGLVVLVGVGAAVAWLRPWAPDVEPASVEKMAFLLPDKPSIGVLPFHNMSGDPEQEYFADGITEDLITDLSKISALFVIARNSTFSYKGRQVKVRQVAEELGVRYILEGSVRRAGDQVRINAQLIDATTGGHLWADRYDGSMADVFALQDKVTRQIVTALAVNLTADEQTERTQTETDNAAAYDAFLQGWAHYRRGRLDDYAKAIPYLEEAIELDPGYSRAYATLAAVYWGARDNAWLESLRLSPNEAWGRAQHYLQEAMNEPTPLAHQVASSMLSVKGQHDEAIAEAERAIALDANDSAGYVAMTRALIYGGSPAEGIDFINKAMRFDPHYPPGHLFWLGLAQFGVERFDEAAATLERATKRNPEDQWSFLVLAATYGHLGRAQDAKSAIERANELRRKTRESAFVRGLGDDLWLKIDYTLAHADFWPFKEQADRERLREGLRKAGVPEAKEGSPLVVQGATTVDISTAKALFDRGVPFVDVRTYGHWSFGHIPSAVLLDLKTDFSEAKLSELVDKDEGVVIYCEGPACLRSSKACAQAVSWGFKKVYYLRDGFPGWKAAGHPVGLP